MFFLMPVSVYRSNDQLQNTNAFQELNRYDLFVVQKNRILQTMNFYPSSIYMKIWC